MALAPQETVESIISSTREGFDTLDAVKSVLPETGFVPAGFAETEIRAKRYAHAKEDGTKETWHEQCRRVASFVANGDTEEEEIYYHLLSNGYMSPGGRVWRNAGSKSPMLDNCFTVGSIPDTREGWAKTFHDLTIISSLGAGWGCDLSDIRPKGAEILGLGGAQQSSGPETVAETTDILAAKIKSAAGRRAALWEGMSIRHPDIEWFISSKANNEYLTNMNISVSFIDECPKTFFEAVDNDDDWELSWQHKEDPDRKVTKVVKARDLWAKWFDAMTTHGDPALMNYSLINERYNCRYLGKKITSCNACSEQPMLAYETCSLSNLVLPRFSTPNGDGTYSFNLVGFVVAARAQTRFLNNIIDAQYYIPEIREHQELKENLRRIGNGIMGLAEHLVMTGEKYSSPGGRDEAARVMRILTWACYDESVNVAEADAPFFWFDADGFLEEGTFASKLPGWLQERIREHGIANSILTNVPPTGTTSLVQGCTGGLEPDYAVAHIRRYRSDGDNGDEWKEEVRVNELLLTHMKNGWPTDMFENGCDVSPEDQIRMLMTIQKEIDAGTSKTVLIPEEYSNEDLENLIKKAAHKLLSFTFYRIGSKEGQPITPIPIESVDLSEHGVITSSTATTVELECEGGACEI